LPPGVGIVGDHVQRLLDKSYIQFANGDANIGALD
jgi:hypothetical protein